MFTKKIKYLPLTATSLLPGQVGKAMNFPQVDCSGTSVCILELGGMYNPTDIDNWCTDNGYTKPQLFNVDVNGALQSAGDADAEVALDICVIAALAPGVKITVVFAPNDGAGTGFVAGLQECINLSPNAISISWGAPSISSWTADTIAAMDAVLAQAKAKKIPVFVAAGDNGSTDGTNMNQCDYPACSPYAIACGGTRLELAADGSRAAETVWSLASDGSGTGGGIATFYSTPDYQAKLTGFPAGRKEPDLAANADPATGYDIEIDGHGGQVVGGTSAVSPGYAAMACNVDAVLKVKNSFDWLETIYQHPECFFDVVAGSNGAYKAQVGYDCCTGMGVLDAGALISVLQGKVPTPVPQPVAPPAPVNTSLWSKIGGWFSGLGKKIGLAKKKYLQYP